MTARSSQTARHATPLLIATALFLFAFVPRVLNGGTFLTIDEAYHWFGRAESFLRALREGRYEATYLVGHPGVTTMWLGAAGIRLHQILADAGWINIADAQVQRVVVRLPVAVATSLCVAVGYGLLRGMVGAWTALVAALLWASEPFLVAHAQLLHTDALLTSFMSVSVIAAVRAWGFDTALERRHGAVRRDMLLVSGIAAALALLTKSPALLLPPFICVIAIVAGRTPARRVPHVPVLPLVAWAAIVVLVCWLLWPALWVRPLGTIADVLRQARAEGGTPHDRGNFFWGATVADPGPWFYPVALAFRMTPWMLAGCVVGAWSLARSAPTPKRTALTLLLLYAILFVGTLTVLPKKFDRYALPAFPALAIIAAVGFTHVAGWIRQHTRRSPVWQGVALLPLVVMLGANLAWYHPYELAYYNPVLGGGSVAARTVPVGWGEGYDQAGAFLSAHTTCDEPVAVRFDPVLEPYLCNPLVPLSSINEPDGARYAVLSIDQMQRGLEPEATTQLQEDAPLLHTVRIHGIDYAYIYEVVPPVAHAGDARFGDHQLRGYTVDAADVRTSGNLLLTLQWSAGLEAVPDEMLFIHVLRADGERIGQIDVPLSGARPQDWTTRQVVTLQQSVPVPPDIAPGPYWVALGVYRPADGARLPLQTSAPADGPDDGADALVLPPTPFP